MSVFLRSASLAVLLSAALAASAANLVKNPGFETGNFSDWTVSPASSASHFSVVPASVNFPAHSGAYAAAFGASAGIADTISQSLTTAPRLRYTVSFYLRSDWFDQAHNTQSFTASFGGASQTFDVVPQTYTLESFTYVPTSFSTDLTLGGYSTNGSYFVDDVSVSATPTPEPGTWAVLGLGGLALIRRRRQVQRALSDGAA